jgi:D-3-phosphoglycerate dehydrogenase
MKIIITDCDHKNIDIETEILNAAGLPFQLLQCKTEDDLIDKCKGANILINQYAPITAKVMKALLPELKQVVRYGVGVNNVDVAAATQLGVQICNVPDYGTDEVADHALALMMALQRKIVLMTDHTKNTGWDYAKAIPVRRGSTQTVGIVGIGRIGKAFAKRVKSLGFKVIAYDPAYPQKTNDEYGFIDPVSMETLLKTSDIISIHCPSDNARGLFDDRAFDLMKNTAYLINTARGGIIDERALDRALAEGKIGGAAVDVVENEPMPPGATLFRHQNFLCTPHMAWYSEESALELKRKAAEEAVRFARGEDCFYPVNIIKK